MTKPINFGRWLGPWGIASIAWINDEDELVEQDHWVRPYQEESHCDTPGCCEMRSAKIGPSLGDVRVVRASCWS